MDHQRSLSIRIDDDIRLKLHYVAKYEGRSANSHINLLIRRDIEKYEAEHGKIELPNDEA